MTGKNKGDVFPAELVREGRGYVQPSSLIVQAQQQPHVKVYPIGSTGLLRMLRVPRRLGVCLLSRCLVPGSQIGTEGAAAAWFDDDLALPGKAEVMMIQMVQQPSRCSFKHHLPKFFLP